MRCREKPLQRTTKVFARLLKHLDLAPTDQVPPLLASPPPPLLPLVPRRTIGLPDRRLHSLCLQLLSKCTSPRGTVQGQ